MCRCAAANNTDVPVSAPHVSKNENGTAGPRRTSRLAKGDGEDRRRYPSSARASGIKVLYYGNSSHSLSPILMLFGVHSQEDLHT